MIFSILHQRENKIIAINAFNCLSTLINLNQLTIGLEYLFILLFKKNSQFNLNDIFNFTH